MFYYLSATGGAALAAATPAGAAKGIWRPAPHTTWQWPLALTLSGLVMLAVPGEATALVLLVFGVVGWIAVVLVSLRFELRR